MYVIFIAKQIVNLDAGETDGSGVDGQLSRIESIKIVADAKFAIESVITAYGVDFVTGVFSQIHHFVENINSV